MSRHHGWDGINHRTAKLDENRRHFINFKAVRTSFVLTMGEHGVPRDLLTALFHSASGNLLDFIGIYWDLKKNSFCCKKKVLKSKRKHSAYFVLF